MHPTTNPFLILLITISTTSLLTGGSLHPQHRHGGGCIPAERAALLSFKKSITRDPTNRLASWHGRDCCRWRGVKCSNRTGHVLKLHLRNPNPYSMSYTGLGCEDVHGNVSFCEISSSLLSLEHLEHLDLSMNYLLDIRVPEFLGSMMNLKYLNLSGIPFSGRVPQFGNLSKLQYLDLGQQEFFGMYSTDITWLTNLPLLQYLDMSLVNLSGIADWPHTLNKIPSLRVIRLSSCSLDTANQSFPYLNLTKLEKLDLSWNKFDHSIASSWFWKATSLKYFNIGFNRLFGQIPDAIGNMSSLQVLDLSQNRLMTTGNLKNLCSLETLDLSGNIEINEYITIFIEGLLKCAWRNLQELHLNDNSFTGGLSDLIGKFTSLSILNLSGNNLTGSIPPGIGYLTCLTALDLYNNHLTGSIPPWIGYLIGLTALDLSFNHLNGSVPSEIGTLSNLTYLHLSKNDLSGVIIKEHFAGLVSLKNVDFSSNNLKVVVDSDWLPPFSLESAVFASCQMGPLFPAWLQRQTEITNLDISNTSIRDKIPNWFWSTFSQATYYLDISHNQISGSLPAHMDDMAFGLLDVSSNQLTGPIPSFPRNTEILDISNNAFSGTIPSNLEAPILEALLMSSNKIRGSIPELCASCKV